MSAPAIPKYVQMIVLVFSARKVKITAFSYQRYSSLKNENVVMIYSHLCCSKPCDTQKRIFWRVRIVLETIDFHYMFHRRHDDRTFRWAIPVRAIFNFLLYYTFIVMFAVKYLKKSSLQPPEQIKNQKVFIKSLNLSACKHESDQII